MDIDNPLEAKDRSIMLKLLEQNKIDLAVSDWEMSELDSLKLCEGM